MKITSSMGINTLRVKFSLLLLYFVTNVKPFTKQKKEFHFPGRE